MRADWPGHFYDGVTARRQEVTVVIQPAGLSIRLADGSAVWRPYAELRQVPATVSDQPVRIEFRGGPEILLVPDRGFIDAARALAPEAAFRHERGNPRLLVALLLLVALIAAMAAAVAFYGWAGGRALEALAAPGGCIQPHRGPRVPLTVTAGDANTLVMQAGRTLDRGGRGRLSGRRSVIGKCRYESR